MCRGRLLIRQPQPGATQTVSKGQQAHGHELTAFPLMRNCIPSLCVSLSHWHLREAGVLVSFEGRGTTGPQPTELRRPVFQIIKIEENLLKLITLFYGADTHTQFCSGTILAVINKNTSMRELLPQMTFRPCRLSSDSFQSGPWASGSVQILFITHFDSFNARMSLKPLFIILCTGGY